MSFSPKDISFYIISLGCFKNQSDSEFLNGALLNAGFTASEDESSADIVIINTCGFIEDAKRESLQEILDIEKDPTPSEHSGFRRRLVVCGCLSRRYMSQMKEEIPEIDLLYGLVDDALTREICRNFDINVPDLSPAYHARAPLSSLPYEFIKIGEGCSNNCSYCAIPLIRGPRLSFSPECIIADAKSALDRGARELVLMAQDTAAYDYNGNTLADLLYRVAGLKPEMIRIMYIHPDNLTQQIIRAMADIPVVAPYLDLPFQHADDGILLSMNRSGSAPKYLDLLTQIRETIPAISIRSTFMVGYPGEDARAFENLSNFVSQAKLDRAGFFTYSREEGTASYVLGDTPQKIKVARYNEINSIQEEITRACLDQRVGSRTRVIVEEQSAEDQWMGRSEFDAPEIDGVFFLTGCGELLHTIVEAVITDTAEFDLVGETCSQI